jgi:hypothetical protein
VIDDAAVASQVSPGRDNTVSEGQDSHKTLFDDFKPADWAAYSKMLDAHERAAWLAGYQAAKIEIMQLVIQPGPCPYNEEE